MSCYRLSDERSQLRILLHGNQCSDIGMVGPFFDCNIVLISSNSLNVLLPSTLLLALVVEQSCDSSYVAQTEIISKLCSQTSYIVAVVFK